MSKKKKVSDLKIAGTNRKALAQYHIIETLEAGIVLTGPEVKSLRAGGVNLRDGFARIEKDELFLWNVHISPYSYGSTHVEQNPTRTRKLLVKRTEMKRFFGKMSGRGLTLIPLEIYFNKRNRVKVKLGLGKGKNAPDQRADIKKRTIGRELQREFAGKFKVK